MTVKEEGNKTRSVKHQNEVSDGTKPSNLFRERLGSGMSGVENFMPVFWSNTDSISCSDGI